MRPVSVILLVALALLSNCEPPPDFETPCPSFPIPVPVPSSVFDTAFRAVDVMLSNATKVEKLAGMIAVIVYNDTIIWSNGYGQANFTDPSSLPPTIDHLFEVASITKVWTALLAFALRDAGKLNMDDDVRKYLPRFEFVSPYGSTRPMTLRQLAAHTSGIRRDLPWPCGDETCDETTIYKALRNQLLVVPPNSRFHYSNVGFDLLGHAAAAAVGQTYQDAMKSLLFEPLNVTASLVYDPTTLKRMAVGRSSDGKPVKVQSGGWEAPCEDLLASARDIAKLMSFYFDDGPHSSSRPVDKATAMEMLNPVTVMKDGSSAVGIPFEMKYERGVWMKGKQGQLEGYRSSMTMVTELKLGVFVSVLEDNVSEESVWTLPILDLVIPPLVSYLWTHQPVVPLPSNYHNFVGAYSANTTITVSSTEPPVLLLAVGSSVFNLTSVMDHTTRASIPNVLRAKDTTIPQPACRWLQDGPDEELVYFEFAQPNQPANRFEFAGMKWDRRQ